MNNNLAKSFLLISLFFGTLFLLIVPAYNSPDEDSHFQYAYQVSTGNFLPKVVDGVSGFDVPDVIIESINRIKPITESQENKYSYKAMHDDLMTSSDYTHKQFSNAVIQTAPKLAYVVPALGILVGKCMRYFVTRGTPSPVVLLQFARFFSLIIYSIIGYYAIKITPKFKKSFFVVLLLPVSLFLRSMVTYDGILLVVTALVLANILKLLNSKDKISKKDYILFIICGFLLLNVKMVYSIVFFGLLFVPKEVFGDNKKKIKSILTIIFSILGITILKMIPYMFVNVTKNSTTSMQLETIIANPFNYIMILARNIVSQRRIQEYWMLGTLGYLDTYISPVMLFVLRIYLITIFLIDACYEKIILPICAKLGYLALIMFVIAGIYTMMYLDWTPIVTGKYGGKVIEGVQGRYYLPLLLLVPIIINNKIIEKIKSKKIVKILDDIKKIVDNNFQYVTIIILVVVTFTLFIRYYC